MIETEPREGYETGQLEFILLPIQIHMFWDAIKYAYAQSSGVPEKLLSVAFHSLLVDLLCGVAACAVVLTKERRVESVVVVHVIEEVLTKDKTLFIDALYSFLPASQDDWLKKGARLIEFAQLQECKRIKGNTGNKKLHEIIQAFGVTEVYRCYSLDF